MSKDILRGKMQFNMQNNKRNCKQRYKQNGYVLTTELVLLACTLVLGTVIGWVAIRDALLQEMFDFASAIENQTYYAFDGLSASQLPAGFANSTNTNQQARSSYIAPLDGEGGLIIVDNGDDGSVVVLDPDSTDPVDPPVDPLTPPVEPPSDLLLSETPFLDLIDPLGIEILNEKISIRDCIVRGSSYNINIVSILGGALSGQCETIGEPQDPSTIPDDLENIAFLDLLDPITALVTDVVSINDCVSLISGASGGQLFINQLAVDGVGFCQPGF